MKTTYRQEIEEVEAQWQGRAVLVDFLYEAKGAWTQYYPQTLLSPEEPSYFDVAEETFTVHRVTDVETESELVLTDELRAFVFPLAEMWVMANREKLDTWIAEEATERWEGELDAEIDRKIDERRDR